MAPIQNEADRITQVTVIYALSPNPFGFTTLWRELNITSVLLISPSSKLYFLGHLRKLVPRWRQET